MTDRYQVDGVLSTLSKICSPSRHLLGINESADSVLLTHKSRKDNTIVLFHVLYEVVMDGV